MKEEFAAQVLKIYVGENDQWHGRPLYAALVEALKSAGLSGVTVLHGIEGFGASGRLHTDRIEVLFEGLPLVIEAVDTREKVTEAMAVLDQMLTQALVTIRDVTAIRYRKG
jgi:PII-like signaling protein